ncbi:hemicentin-1 isoform X2 [Silurus meridionalis]|uniref:hemicentin-1 isoform X2 n=1 Tax=Silurus meridionalis TaxID=175797 RepID=UPI001EEC2BD9|nr:hemicentin-1 isoform X2 [Silurus meridionalis]
MDPKAPPMVDNAVSEVKTVVGESVTLPCVLMGGAPPPEIVWMREGQKVQNSEWTSIRNDGSLHMKRAAPEHAGKYMCTGTNVAGSVNLTITLKIHVPPVISASATHYEAAEGVSVSLPCETTGTPKPSITWTKGDEPVSFPPQSDGSLLIFSSTAADSGRYICIASSSAGETHKEITLTVHSKPRILGAHGHTEVISTTVNEGSEIILPCEVEGSPTPTVSWSHNEQILPPITARVIILPSGSLKIRNVQMTDSNFYTCTAENPAGVNTLTYRLHIQVPPRIVGQQEEDVSAVEGQMVSLLCNVQAHPAPKIIWTKDGKQLRLGSGVEIVSGGKMLQISRLQQQDAGQYVCTATSTAGQTQKSIKLNVHVPPTIMNSDPADVSAQVGEELTLKCHAEGTPTPQLTWMRNGVKVDTSERVHVSANGSTLTLLRVTEDDSGIYKCLAVSPAGQESKVYSLLVLAPAMVKHTEPMEHIVIVRGSVVSLVCEAHGVPSPVFTWLKDGDLLSLHQNKLLHDGGESRFQLLNVQLEDTGLYSCIAKNQAGNSSKTFNLTVLEPPKISSSLRREELMVVVNGVLEMECLVDGVPPPTVSWMKDGGTLEDSRGVLHRDGQILTISNIKAEDAGVYTCVVSNPAGEDRRRFWVHVQSPPKPWSDITTVSVPFMGHMTLECRTDGKIPPDIQWYKDDIKLQLGGRIQSIAGGQYLDIGDVRQEDSGNYSCVMFNMAGSSSLHFNVQILLHPVIREGSPLVTAHVNQKVVLPCEVEGDTAPSVLWRKDGVPVVFNNRLVWLPDGSIRIESVQLSDAGHYYCSASNNVGSDQRSMELRVYVAPSIRPGNFNVTLLKGRRAVLSCEAFGVPPPQVNWKRNGHTLNTDSGTYRLIPSGSLLIISPSLEDEGYFECTVTSEVGEERRVIEVTFQVPPSIEDDVITLTAIKMESVVLPCHVTGRPTPSISWSRGGTVLGTGKGSYKILPTGMLEIGSVNPTHAGRYTCSAQNTAGVTQKHIILSVHEAPEIRNMVKEIKVLLNQEVVLNCDVHGFPKPSVTWLKDGVPIAAGQSLKVLSGGTLRLSKVTLGDAGTYSCLAQNAAGTMEGKTQLLLQVPPVISVPHNEYTLSVGESVSVPCSAIGQPEPELQWHKLDGGVRGGAKQFTFTNGTLQIKKAQLEHAGVYTCTASNSAGRTSHDITLTLHVAPMIHGGQSEVSVIQGFQSLLPCLAQGVPNPTIHWKKNGKFIQNLQGRFTVLRSGELIIERTQLTDAGVYTCVAVNAAGSAHHKLQLSVNMRPEFKEIPSDMTLKAGQNLSLICHVQSTPPAVIKWTVNNHPYTGFSVDETGRSLLMIENVSVRDSGSYVCSAENSVGSIRTLAFIRITEPPVLTGVGRISVFVSHGAVVVLDCPVRGTPAPVLRWFKDGRLLQVNDHLHRLHNGSLVLYGAMSMDSGDYQCVAENEVGVIERMISLKVQVAGGNSHWEPWGPCSVTCGHGLQERTRFCNNPAPVSGGAECEGPDVESRQCQASLCSGDSLRRARASVIGMVNDHEFGISFLKMNITENSESRSSTLKAYMEDIPPSVGPLLKVLISALSPIYWTAVYESAGMKNGFSISHGFFRQESQLEFHTGEILKITHVARGLDEEGVLLVDVVINGFIPSVFLSPVIHQQDFDETYVQVGSGQIYSWSTQNSLQQGVGSMLTLRCNHSLVFDGSVKPLAPLLQQIHLSDISSSYNMLNFRLDFHITATLSLPDGDGQKCPEGFKLNEASYCTDADECVSDSPCSHSCINIMGGFSCSCPSGFTINIESNSCQDIDECVDGSHMCLHNQLCMNTVGNYRCEVNCGPGFRHRTAGTNNRTRTDGCEDVDECVESSVSPCQHQCFNTLGSFRCSCLPGYQLVGHRCFDINECMSSVCPSHQQCKNTEGGYECFDSCPPGMTQSESSVCVDVDECKDGSHMCRYSQVCQNTFGGYVCLCPRGYRSQGVGKPCIDVDECAQTPSPCGYQCRNVPGSFRCLCPPGTVLLVDGRSCAGLERRNGFNNRTRVRVGLQPQLVSSRGQTLTLLQNTQPGTTWSNSHSCPPGYTNKASSCVDIDECVFRKPCQHECRNSLGSFHCFCPSGYLLMPNGQTCRDIDECTERSVQCGPNQMCFNMRGSYQCLDTPCPASYHRGGSPGVCYKPCSHGCAAGSSLLLQYKLLTLPLGIPAQQNVIRLSAFSESGVLQERTVFTILDQNGEVKEQLFGIKDEAGRGIIFTTRYLNQSGLEKLKVQATTINQHGQITYQSLFIIYISISAFPY